MDMMPIIVFGILALPTLLYVILWAQRLNRAKLASPGNPAQKRFSRMLAAGLIVTALALWGGVLFRPFLLSTWQWVGLVAVVCIAVVPPPEVDRRLNALADRPVSD